jgi:hypothetical protein
MWTHLKNQPAYATLSSQSKTWFAFHHAIALREDNRMTTLAGEIIQNSAENQLDQKQIEYLLSAGIVGALSSGGKQKASQFWSRYGILGSYFQTEPELHLQLLLAQLD